MLDDERSPLHPVRVYKELGRRARPRRDRGRRRRRLRLLRGPGHRDLRARQLDGPRPLRLPRRRPRPGDRRQGRPPRAPGLPAARRRRLRLRRDGVRHDGPPRPADRRGDGQQRDLGARAPPDEVPLRLLGGRRAPARDPLRRGRRRARLPRRAGPRARRARARPSSAPSPRASPPWSTSSPTPRSSTRASRTWPRGGFAGRGYDSAQDRAELPSDPVRQVRRRLDRLPGRRRWADRPGPRPRLHHPPRAAVGVASDGSLLRAAQLVLAPDHLRQARQRALRPRHRGADPRASDRRRPGGDGRRRIRAGGPLRDLRGRSDERAVRGHSSRTRLGTGAPRRHGAHHRGARLPLGRARGGASRVRRRVHRALLGTGRGGDGRALLSELRGRSPGGGVHRPSWSAPPRARRWSSRSSRCSWTSTCEPSCPRSTCRRSSSTGAATGSSIDAPARSSPRRSRAPATSSCPGSTTSPWAGDCRRRGRGDRGVPDRRPHGGRARSRPRHGDVHGHLSARRSERRSSGCALARAARGASGRGAARARAIQGTRGEDAGRRPPRHLRRPGAGDSLRAARSRRAPARSASRCASGSTPARSR